MNSERVVSIYEVFNVSRGLPQNYIERKLVDEVFIDALSQDTHIVIHGSSKQGKTSLRRSILKDEECIVITCLNKWNLEKIHESILKAAGYKITQSEQKTVNGDAKFKLVCDISLSASYSNEIIVKPFDIDLSDANDVIHALKQINFDKKIVLEDFHYLPEDTQQNFSYALKAFQDSSKLVFIIIGVWLDGDKIASYNGDLKGRIRSINVDIWLDADFDKLFFDSEALLNILFDKENKEEIKKLVGGNIFIVQQLCAQLCEKSGVTKTIVGQQRLLKKFDIKEEIKYILIRDDNRYNNFISGFSSGFSNEVEVNLYKWIIYLLISIDDRHFENGFPIEACVREIEKKCPDDFNQKKLDRALKKSLDLHEKLKIRPLIFEYDTTKNRIKIVDKAFLLWRAFQDKTQLYEHADLMDGFRKKGQIRTVAEND